MEIILIAAMAANRVIGLNNTIPWHLPGEQQRFKEITWGHTLIMGRKTHESIGRALPGRRNIIITRNPQYLSEGCETASSLADAYQMCKGAKRVFNIGGEQLYRQGLGDADKLILTVLQKDIDGDTFFPSIPEKEFQLIDKVDVIQPVAYSILTYLRIKI
jgi:dihydrofolate reductase